MSFRLALAQVGYPSDEGVIEQVRRFAKEAARLGTDLVVFPENLMCPRELSADELARIAEPLDGPFAQACADVARSEGVWMVAHMAEENPTGAPFNTALVIDDAGALRGSYRKCHLYDAHQVRESDRMTAGDAPFTPIKTPFCTLGLGICYDLRFPEVARTQALAGANVVLFPSAWHDGPNKPDHWETLLRARAIENELFVAGVCHAGDKFAGNSLAADPLGRVIARIDGKGEGLLVCDIDLGLVTSARDAMPVLDHRRPDTYGASPSSARYNALTGT